MHARVMTFPADTDRRILETPVEGAVRSLALVRRDDGGVLSIALFDAEPAARESGEVYAVATEQLRPERAARYARIATHHGFPMRDVSPRRSPGSRASPRG